ncbi:hypothetical protein C475_05095 [Halosimplex carlsbadense 2-9-1]|uniref:Lipoprotein n=1 Tax=Halosimplex carlsbadense 2-9-1 TaxID=797114 RepID=M0D1X4_9EURY|nr:hypothetical protein C475_05095 [Halosimplex carlsbadense 2-9-1]
MANGTAGGSDTDDAAVENRSDPETDRLGWEGGYWYNETIDVDQSDGLSESERPALVARAMARVERVRGLEFRSEVPVTVVSQSQFASAQRSRSTSTERRVFTNAKFEALFMVNESRDAVAVRRNGTASSVGGFYSSIREEIVLISSDGEVRVDESTLAHELTHALQDQHFGLSQFERPTREAHNAIDDLVEGDANLVGHLYERRCAGAWNGTCLAPPADPAEGGAGSLPRVGPYLLRYQPYSDGPAFVNEFRQRGGWERVNALYEEPPASTEQTIHPHLYGEDEPRTVTVTDRSSAGWERLRVDGRPDYASVGEAGLASMFVRPAVATQGQVSVVPASDFFARNDSLDPYNYSTPYSAGWDGDRLVVYRNPSTPATEFGYVFRTAWDSPAEAREFADGYRQLLDIEGAEPVDGRNRTWRIEEGTGFGDAFRLRVTDETVTVVNAPSVEGLSDVHREAGNRSDR